MIKYAPLIVFWLGLFHLPDMPQAGVDFLSRKTPAPGTGHYVLIIDFDYLNCTLCMDALHKFLDFIHTQKIRNIYGIITVKTKRLGSDMKKKAVKQQVKGFKIGNRIRFPIYMDARSVFAPCRHQGAALLLFDSDTETVLRYGFPLSQDVFDRMLPTHPFLSIRK